MVAEYLQKLESNPTATSMPVTAEVPAENRTRALSSVVLTTESFYCCAATCIYWILY